MNYSFLFYLVSFRILWITLKVEMKQIENRFHKAKQKQLQFFVALLTLFITNYKCF